MSSISRSLTTGLASEGRKILGGAMRPPIKSRFGPRSSMMVAGLVVGVLERRGAFEGRWRWELPRRIDIRRLRRVDYGVLVGPEDEAHFRLIPSLRVETLHV